MSLPIIYEFKKLPEINLQVNTTYLLDHIIIQDDIVKFINNTISKCDYKPNNYVVFTRNPEKNAIYKLSSSSLYTFITYFKGSGNQLAITEIDHDKYKYKQFNDETQISVIKLEQNIQVQVDNFYHVILGEDDYDILYIHILDYNPGVDSYNGCLSIKSDDEYVPIEITNKESITVKENFDYDFFNGLLYENKTKQTCIFGNKLTKGCLLKVSCYPIVENMNIALLNKDIDDTNNNRHEYKNRFNNKYIIKNLIDPVFCDFILTHSLINIKKMPIGSVLDLTKILVLNEPLAFYIYRKILPELSLHYNIPDDYCVNAKFITLTDISNDEDCLTKRDIKRLITIDILLSKTNIKDGHSHNFHDNTRVSLSTGDCLIYNSNNLNNDKLVKEQMYVLSIYVDIFSFKRLTESIF